MRMTTAIATTFLLLITGLSAVAQDEKTSDATAKNPFLGEYIMESGVDNGEKVPENRIRGGLVRITEDTITAVDEKEQEIYVCKYKLTSAKSPYKVDMTIAGGPRGKKGDKASGIIELKGDTLRLAYGYGGTDAPESFDEIGKNQVSFTMMTKKKDD